MNHLKIIVPFYNVEKWILYNIRSIKKQEYKNYECILVNDHSTDNTVDIIEKEIEGNDNFNLYTNVEKTGALGSTSYGIDKCAPNNENIIIILDGDDWFPNESVLGYLNVVIA
jgi:glycosyltransferase involved in cell wall biosynthesis